jgi:hypothetical protein
MASGGADALDGGVTSGRSGPAVQQDYTSGVSARGNAHLMLRPHFASHSDGFAYMDRYGPRDERPGFRFRAVGTTPD